jgi:hypothetical protein
MEFNKQTLKSFRIEMEEALSKLEKKHKVTFNIGNIRFNTDTFTTTLKCYSKAQGKSDIGKLEWAKTCLIFGFKPEDFGRTFEFRGKRYIISGVKPRSFKYPIVGKEINGTKTFKFTIDGVKKNLV